MTPTERIAPAPPDPSQTRAAARPGRGEGLRERKRRETYRLLATTALELVAERGLDRVTVEDVSTAVGVSPRTFFNYFPSKEDALLLPYPDMAERSARAVERIVTAPQELSPLRAIVWAWREELESVDADRQEWVTRLTALTDHAALVSRLVALAAEDERRMIAAIARRTGRAEDDPYPVLVYHVAEGAARACYVHWHRLGGAHSLVELVDRAVAAVEDGLPAHPAPAPRTPAAP